MGITVLCQLGLKQASVVQIQMTDLEQFLLTKTFEI